MKVQLIVVRGKPEGKIIPLAGPAFKIGRGEGCHLRPNSDQVSREHAEFIVDAGAVSVQDLKSRNGTQVNGKDIVGLVRLKDRDLVQVGPLTFAVSIQGAPAPAQAAAATPGPGRPAAPAPVKPVAPAAQARSAPEEVLNEDIDSWLVGAPSESSTEIPTSVYGGETVTIATFQGGKPEPPPTEEEDEEEEDEDEEEEEELEEDEEEEDEDEEDELEEDEEEEEEAPAEEFVDESNPFHVAKKAQQQTTKTEAKGPAGQQFQDTSGAASEILKKLMERRKASR